MDDKPCGCKGIRSCLVCEKSDSEKEQLEINKSVKTNQKQVYHYCVKSGTARQSRECPHDTSSDILHFPGIFIILDFVTAEEEEQLTKEIYKTPFSKSQSGRCKQDFGPKVNFKKQKVRTDVFSGLPSYSKFLYERIQAVQCLKDFVPIELCNLEYVPERGSAIDPHFDDFWIWGERLVTLNLLSDTTLYFTHDDKPDIEVRVPLLQRSLISVFGPARTEWKHGIHRHDINSPRIAMTFRELADEFRSGGKSECVGQNLIDLALTFSGTAVGVVS